MQGVGGYVERCHRTANAIKWLHTDTKCLTEEDVKLDRSWAKAKREFSNIRRAHDMTTLAPYPIRLDIRYDEETQQCFPVIEMEWIQGKPISLTKMSEAKLVNVIDMVDRELSALGIFHGDLTDFNVMWYRGKVRVVDWANAVFT